MGGGKKQNQRTKGNVKPSRSSKAAEMLIQDGKTGFLGFGGLSEAMGNAFGYVPKSVGGDEEDELKIDSDLRMLMRKMGKKDTTTKLKAVQEFTQLCSEKAPNDLVKILSFWPRIYNKLSEDYDHRVREAMQLAHLEIVKKVGRKLAPQLKMIISSWLKSQFDQFAPAASAAKTSFDVTFPADKKKDVISFCKKDLLTNMYDILIKQTRDTLSDPRVIPEEEREAKYNRLVSSTLLSFGYVMEVLQKDDMADVSEHCENIFREKKFWKYSKHKAPMVRAAFFTVLSSACQYNSEILGSHTSVLCPSVLCSLDESEPTVVSSFWDCLLRTVTTFEECWSHVNARKAVLPKLWSVLRKGGFGNAVVIFPNMLPFLSKIPKSAIGDEIGFAREFFSNIKEGLSFDRTMFSTSESIAMMKALMECLRYMLFNFGSEMEEMESATKEETDENIVEYLINEEVGFLLENSMGVKSYPWRITFLVALRDLIIFMEKQVTEREKRDDIYSQALCIMHQLLQNFAVSLLNADGENNYLKKELKNFEELIKIVVFRTGYPQQRQKKQMGFARKDDDFDLAIEDREEKLLNSQSDEYILPHDAKMDNLSEWIKLLLKELCSNCIKLLFEKRNIIFIEFLSDVLSCIEDRTDFNELITQMLLPRKSLEFCQGIPQFRETGNPYDDVILTIIQPIMMEDFSSDESYWSSTDCQLAVIGLLCKMLGFTRQSEMPDFLKQITEISTKPYMFSMLVEKIFGTIDADCSASWFKRCDIWSQLLRFASDQCVDDVISEESKSAFESVFHCVETCLFFENGSLFAESSTDPLFDIFTTQLTSEASAGKKIVNERILALLANFYSNANSVNMITSRSLDVMIAVFQFTNKLDDTQSIEQANCVLKNGFLLLLRSPNVNHQRDLENVLQKIAYWTQRMCENASDQKDIQHLSYCCGQVVNICNSDSLDDSLSIYPERFLTQLTSSLRRYLESTNFSSQRYILDAIVLGTLSIANLPEEKVAAAPIASSQLNNALFAMNLISSLQDFQSSGKDVIIKAVLDSICIICLATKTGSNEDEFHASTQADDIESSIKNLLTMENFPSEALLNFALDRALESGGLNTLALQKLFSVLPQSTLLKFPISDLLGRTISRGEDDSNSLDGLKLIMSNLEDLSIIRALVEQYVDQLCNDNIETIKGFSFPFELCLASITRWQSMLEPSRDSSLDLNNVIKTILTRLIGWRDASQDALLFSVDLAQASDEQLSLNITIMKMLSFCLECGGARNLDNIQWDFILCSLASWIQTCEENISALSSCYRTMLFALWACNLCTSVNEAFDRKIGGDVLNENTILLRSKAPWIITNEWKRKYANQISDELVTEWQEFFIPAIFKSIYLIYSELLASSSAISDKQEGATTMLSHLLKSACCAINGMPSTLLLDLVLGNRTFEEQLQQGSVPNQSSNGSRDFDTSQTAMIQKTYFQFIELLNSDVLCLQILAHAILCKLMIVSHSVALSLTTESVEGDECDTIRSFPDKLMDVLQANQETTLAFLEENSAGFGSYMTQPPSAETSKCILAFLLAWQITLRQFRDSEAGHRASFANFFRKRNMIGPLLTILFSILPHDKGHLLSADCIIVEGDELSLRQIRQFSFHLYLTALECIPAVIRSWCNNNLDKKSAIITERFTTAFASPVLCSREIDQVATCSKTFTNMSIKTRPAAREVVAVYSVEEISMELVVKMSPSHPLGPVVVDCGKRVGVTTGQWRQWMLQLTKFLTQQNGTIVDGLALWKRNVDKKFEGVEECMICFAVVHGTNYQLPTIICRVCKKGFHSACLYKWFNTSNKSTCPLCRTSF